MPLQAAESGVEEDSEEEEEANESEEMGCILAHSMGLGKTLQTIAFLHSYHHHFPEHRSLLIMPKNVIYNWMTEFEIWLRRVKPAELTLEKVGPPRDIGAWEGLNAIAAKYGGPN